ncbi:MAG: TIR domain-containing protein, partial [Candidatus Thiodiazotropha sp. 6PDIVS]
FAQQLLALTPLNSSPHHLLPVALDSSGFDISDRQHILPALLANDLPTEEGEQQRLAEISFHIAARAIQLLEYGKVPALAPDRMQAPVSIFLSHAKADLDKDQQDPVRQTRAVLGELPVDVWYDAGEISTGQDFADAIQAGIRDCNIVLAFQTDQYSSRPWCRREVLEAKRHGAHVLIVDALQSGETRSFPYMGNVPTIRWQFGTPGVDARRVIDRAVLEALRLTYNRAMLERVAEPGDVILPVAPEALTLANVCDDEQCETSLLYPDPPLGREELEILQRLRPNAHFLTPLSKVAQWQRPTHINTITVSISESEDVTRYGLSQAHFATLTDEIHLYLLLAGLKIAYGGGLKGNIASSSNFTLRLFELVRTYSKLAQGVNAPPLTDAIHNLAPWPLLLIYGDDEWKLFSGHVATYEAGQRPDLPWSDDELFPVTDKGRMLASDTPERRYAWALGLTAMRCRITELSEARLVIGGKMRGFSGLVPGVVEEAWLSLKQNKPLYLVGGYGGAARAVADLLLGRQRPEFDNDWARQHLPDYDMVLDLYAQQGIDVRTLEQIGADITTCAQADLAKALNNGLTETENRELMDCTNTQRVATLVLTGLGRL